MNASNQKEAAGDAGRFFYNPLVVVAYGIVVVVTPPVSVVPPLSPLSGLSLVHADNVSATARTTLANTAVFFLFRIPFLLLDRWLARTASPTV